MKYFTLKILIVFHSFGFTQLQELTEKNDKFSVKNCISKSHPNFGPEFNSYNKRPIANGTKKITRIRYKVNEKTGEIDLNKSDTSFQEFNKYGKIILETSSSRNWCSKSTYKYNDKNNILLETSYDCDNKVNYKTEYTYSHISIIESFIGPYSSKVIYTLDKLGNKVKREDYDGERKSSYWIKKYDSNRNVIDFKLYTSNDYLEFHEVYTYGIQNELISSEVIKFPEDLTDLYDFSGNQMISYHEAKIRKYEYDEINNIVTEFQMLENKKPIKIIYSFDQFGNLTRIEETVNDSKTLTKFSNKYDDYGNIIEQKYSWKGKVNSISKASIEYYK